MPEKLRSGRGFFAGILLLFLLILQLPTLAAGEGLQPFDHFGGYPGGSALKGDYAYLIQATVLTVLDITGAEMRRVGYLTLPEEPNQIIIEDDTAYLFFAGSDSGVRLVDLSDPVRPRLMQPVAVKTAWTSRGFVANGLIYLLIDDTLTIIDAADPAAIAVKSTSKITATDVFVRGNLAYLICTDGLHILDVSDPAKPGESGFLALSGGKRLWIQDGLALISGQKQNEAVLEFTTVNVADSSKPVLTGKTTAQMAVRYFYSACITAVPGTAYVTAGAQLFIFEYVKPAAPEFKGTYEHLSGAFTSLQAVPPFLYGAMGTSDYGFIRIDVADIAHPAMAAFVLEPWDVVHMCGQGEMLYVESAERLFAFDLTHPKPAALASANPRWPNLYRMTAVGSCLYAISQDSLHIIDISDPRAMREKGGWAVPSAEMARGIMVQGNLASLLTFDFASRESQLYRLDVSNAANIQLKGRCSFAGEGRDLVLSPDGMLAGVAYSGDGSDQGVRLIDLADPAAPRVVGSGPTRALPMCQWFADSLLFVGSNTAGQGEGTWHIEVLNVADPSVPVQIGEATGSGMVVDLEVSDGKLYASIRGGSVYEFEHYIKNGLVILGLLHKCPSPSSIFLVLFHLSRMFYAFTCDGAISPDGTMVSASLGIFAQYKEVTSLVDSLFQILIAPSANNMAVGQTQTFKAEGKDQQGNPVALKNPAWSSTSGKGTLQPSPDGSSCEYTAKSAGNDSLLCTEQGTKIKGVSTIQINATAVVNRPAAPLAFSLAQNHPNPFNPVTTIGYTVKERCRVNLQVYDLLGRWVATLVDEERSEGEHRVIFDAREYPSGVLLYRIQMKEFSAVRKMVLLE